MNCRATLLLFACFAGPKAVVAWEAIDDDGWCCWEYAHFHLNPTSFTTLAPGSFPNYYTVIDQVCLSASYWNEAGSEFRFERAADTTSCGTYDNEVCMVPENDPRLVGPNIALTHWDIDWCFTKYGEPWTGIASFHIVFKAGAWNTRYGAFGGAPDFYKTAAHEFGHALGLGHEFDKYQEIIMSYGGNLTMITEDDSQGAEYFYGKDIEPLRFITATLSSTGLTNFSAPQVVSDSAHVTFAHPAIAGHPGSQPRAFDFAVAWTRPSDRQVTVELIKMTGYASHTSVRGPWHWSGWESWQGPSIGVNEEGRFALAFRYEKNNPNHNDPNELQRNSMIRMLVSNPDHTVVYNVEPGSCAGNNVCRTINTPAISYSVASRRWVLAFIEAGENPQTLGNMNSVTLLVSDDNTGLYWSRPPLRTGKHSTYIAPALSCYNPSGASGCMLIYADFVHPNGWIARLRQAAFRLTNCNHPSGLCEVANSNFDFGRSGFGRAGLASAPEGWVLTRIDTPSVAHDNLTWTFKPASAGLSGNAWGADQHNLTMLSEKGFSVSCARFGTQTWCRFVWSYE